MRKDEIISKFAERVALKLRLLQNGRSATLQISDFAWDEIYLVCPSCDRKPSTKFILKTGKMVVIVYCTKGQVTQSFECSDIYKPEFVDSLASAINSTAKRWNSMIDEVDSILDVERIEL